MEKDMTEDLTPTPGTVPAFNAGFGAYLQEAQRLEQDILARAQRVASHSGTRLDETRKSWT